MKVSRVRTERMRAVVEAIAGHLDRYGYAPSVRELRRDTGMSSLSIVSYWLHACERECLIERAPGLARAIVLTEAGAAFAADLVDEESPTARGGRVA